MRRSTRLQFVNPEPPRAALYSFVGWVRVSSTCCWRTHSFPCAKLALSSTEAPFLNCGDSHEEHRGRLPHCNVLRISPPQPGDCRENWGGKAQRRQEDDAKASSRTPRFLGTPRVCSSKNDPSPSRRPQKRRPAPEKATYRVLRRRRQRARIAVVLYAVTHFRPEPCLETAALSQPYTARPDPTLPRPPPVPRISVPDAPNSRGARAPGNPCAGLRSVPSACGSDHTAHRSCRCGTPLVSDGRGSHACFFSALLSSATTGQVCSSTITRELRSRRQFRTGLRCKKVCRRRVNSSKG